MTEITPINGSIHLASAEPMDPKRSSGEPEPAQAASAVDRVEISAAGRALSETQPEAANRTEKVARIRAQIASGSYETDERIAVTAERLLDALRKSIAK